MLMSIAGPFDTVSAVRLAHISRMSFYDLNGYEISCKSRYQNSTNVFQ